MAGGGTGQAQSQSTTTPQNLQLGNYTGLASGVSQGLWDLFGLNPGGVGTPNGMFSPFQAAGQNANDPNTNPLVAPVTGGQLDFLSRILGTNASGQNSQASSVLSPFTNTPGGIGASYNALVPQTAGTLQSFLDPNYAANLATSPQTKTAIGSATAPIFQAFNTQTLPILTGQATAGGQRAAGPGQAGSSAFDQALNTAQANEAAQLAQTSGAIANQAYQTGLQIQANAPGQIAGTAANLEQATTAALAAPAAITAQEVGTMVNQLQAEALPQLTQQYGINQAVQLFNTQISLLLQALGLGGQISQPAIAYQGQSSSSQTQQTNPNILGALGSSFGLRYNIGGSNG